MKKTWRKTLSIALTLFLLLTNFMNINNISVVKAEPTTILNTDFSNYDGKTASTIPEGWTFTPLLGVYGSTSTGCFGKSAPSLKFGATGNQAVTPEFKLDSSATLKYWLKGNSTDAASTFTVEKYDGKDWTTVKGYDGTITTAVNESVAIESNTTKIRFTYTKKSKGNFALDDVSITEGSAPSQPVPATAITVTPNTAEVITGKTVTLQTAVQPTSATSKILWKSDDTTTATVANGVVTGVKAGMTTITAYSEDNNAVCGTCKVTVKDPQPPVKMTIAQARTQPEGTGVIVDGVVTRVSGDNYYLQDSEAGICLYQSGLTQIVPGVSMEVTGTISNHYDLLEITDATVSENTDSSPIPDPKLVTIDKVDESVESMLIKLVDLTLGTTDSSKNTTFTDSLGKTIVANKMPQLNSNITVGSKVDVIAVGSEYNGKYQLKITDAKDVTIAASVPDTIAPLIVHTPVAAGSSDADYTITANITDDRSTPTAKVYYRTVGDASYKYVDMTAGANNQYTATINKSELSTKGLEYYIYASDASNNVSTSPKDSSSPYKVTIVDAAIHVTSVAVSPKTAEVTMGNTVKLTAAVEPIEATNTKINWSSDDSSVATVANGVVTAVKPGIVTITATSADNPDAKDTCIVTVKTMSIADARKAADGANVLVQGLVTYVDSNNNAFIQDATAGIDVYCVNCKGLVAAGDNIIAKGPLTTYLGLLEIKPAGPDDVTVVSHKNTMPDPKVITIADANKGTYQSQLVKIKNVKLGTIGTNTPITDTATNDAINIYKLPALTGIKSGDMVDVIAVDSIHTTPQLIVRSASDVTIADLGPDTQAPVITTTPVISANTNLDVKITASVTDDRGVKSVTLYYRTTGQTSYKSLDMTLSDGQYSAVIPKADLSVDGLQYYIQATDGTNIVTSPADKTKPYSAIVSSEDIVGPEVTNLAPEANSCTQDNLRPVISAEYTDFSGINPVSIKLYLDDKDITSLAVKDAAKIIYTPQADLTKGQHTAKLEVSDIKGNKTTETWSFTVGKDQYNLYFGMLHGHTNTSDGQGTLDDAFTWARDQGKVDFFATTDHSNWFDNDTSCNINDGSKSTAWQKVQSTADKYYVPGKYVAIGAYEMTWSGSTGGWGHINTFDTKGFETRNNKSMDLKTYYDTLSTATTPDGLPSISQLNHPGTTFGDFADFAYYNPKYDPYVDLVEVGNGEGEVGSNGYFPSYQYYTRALDKGWHVAPTNNQDNHKAKWVTANTCRDVVLATQLTREGIYDALRHKRVYATEDSDLRINYTVNGNPMGTILNNPSKLDIDINIADPDADDNIGKVSIISNGGTVVASKTFDTNKADWQLSLDSEYSYYYVRIDETDHDIAVTAPVWTGTSSNAGLSAIKTSQNISTVNAPVTLSTQVFNNNPAAINNVKINFYQNDISEANKIGEKVIDSVDSGKTADVDFQWTPTKRGTYTIYAQMVIDIGGKQKAFTESVQVQVLTQDEVVKVVIDAAHCNQYVSGNYPGKLITAKGMFANRKIMVVENTGAINDDLLKDAKMLILTDPQSTDDTKNKLTKSLYSDAEVQAIKNFTDKGGSLIITSKADYGEDKATPEYHNAAQGNKVLQAIGSNLRFNDDEVIDNTTNGGQSYRLYFNNFTSKKYHLTDNIPVDDKGNPTETYSFFSGCSVILKDGGSDANVDYMVKGLSTTETMDSDNGKDSKPVTKGNVIAAAAEVLPSGAKIVVAGTTFLSDFELTGDNMYANKQITDNVIKWTCAPKPAELKSIKDVRIDANKDGIPDNLGKRFAIEGRVTAQSEAVTPKNAFFEVIYVQDDTAGITVFGVSKTPLKLGEKVKITGFVDQYQGDSELQIDNEDTDVEVTDSNVQLVQPKLLSTKDSMLEENEGLLVKVQGTITRIGNDRLYVDDGTGEARVYVEGYIGDGSGNADTLGKWDSSIKVGDYISAIGLASEDPEGHRLRVRNTKEIVKQSASGTTVTVNPSDPQSVNSAIAVVNNAPTQNVTLNVTGPAVLSSAFADGVKASGKIVTVNMTTKDAYGNDVYITFTTPAGQLKPLDLTINKTSANSAAITKADSEAMIISFKDNGTLPAPVTLRIKLASSIDASKPVYFYYYNPATKAMELMAGPLTPDKDGYVTVTIKHCSDYFFSNNSKLATTGSIVKTGSVVNTTTLVVTGLALVIAGIALILFRRKRNSKTDNQ